MIKYVWKNASDCKTVVFRKKHEGWCKLTHNCFAVINDFPKQRSEDE